MVSSDDTYQLLRQLTTPVVAITSHHAGKRNGMIIDSAIRASIVPTVPRLAMFIHKFNLSHDLIYQSGCFVLHLLRQDQFELIHRLGFFHGGDRDKLAEIPHRLGRLGAPVLDECYAHFECRVVNAMDTGSSTCFLGDVVEVGYGATAAPQGEVMTAPYFRSHLPASWGTAYQEQLAAAQAFARERSRDIRPVVWRGLGG
jgi:flavin reductase (DIM6/NTAB) family NADH-FMN oxidoreductase RutF